jgi:hypothetical protein
MAQRESSIYLYLFIVAMVLFGIMTTAFFLTSADRDEVLGEMENLKVRLDQQLKIQRTLSDDISRLQELIAGPGLTGDQFPGEEFIVQNESGGTPTLSRSTATWTASSSSTARAGMRPTSRGRPRTMPW